MNIGIKGINHDFECVAIEDCNKANRWLFINATRKQSLFIEAIKDNEDDKIASAAGDVINALVNPDAFDQLCELLNTEDNVTVNISQVPYTTADYLAVRNRYIDKLNDCVTFFAKRKPTNKYCIIEM